jgi:hypothetical protein
MPRLLPRRIVPALVVGLIAGSLVVSGPAPDAVAARPPYRATVDTISRVLRSRMVGVSWHAGCPVAIKDLRLVSVLYWGFDRVAHHGRIVVYRRWAWATAGVFRKLYDARFPIRRMRLIEAYDGNDRASMAADNTSGFNCRYRAGVCCTWSRHAYGLAIDIDTVENPFLFHGGYSPPAGRQFLDRSQHRRGMIHHGDIVWRAFHTIGWGWGGDWPGEKDYQHFSSNGR